MYVLVPFVFYLCSVRSACVSRRETRTSARSTSSPTSGASEPPTREPMTPPTLSIVSTTRQTRDESFHTRRTVAPRSSTSCSGRHWSSSPAPSHSSTSRRGAVDSRSAAGVRPLRSLTARKVSSSKRRRRRHSTRTKSHQSYRSTQKTPPIGTTMQ